MRLTFDVTFPRQRQFLPLLVGAILAAPGTAAAQPVTEAAPLTADVACTASRSDKQFGYRYRYDVALSVRQGKVQRLKLSQRATSKHGDDQGCEIALDDLEQVPAEGSILLRERGVAPNDKPRCTVRITADRKEISIQVGDAAEEGNDCRGGEATMYCSPRSFWAGMIVNRGSKRCRPQL